MITYLISPHILIVLHTSYYPGADTQVSHAANFSQVTCLSHCCNRSGAVLSASGPVLGR